MPIIEAWDAVQRAVPGVRLIVKYGPRPVIRRRVHWRMSHVTFRLLRFAHRMSRVACCMLRIACRLLRSACRMVSDSYGGPGIPGLVDRMRALGVEFAAFDEAEMSLLCADPTHCPPPPARPPAPWVPHSHCRAGVPFAHPPASLRAPPLGIAPCAVGRARLSRNGANPRRAACAIAAATGASRRIAHACALKSVEPMRIGPVSRLWDRSSIAPVGSRRRRATARPGGRSRSRARAIGRGASLAACSTDGGGHQSGFHFGAR